MRQSRLTIGVDGCRGGWLASFFEDGKFVRLEIVETFEKLWDSNKSASLILVDIPIGLKDGGSERECDILARSLLGSRASSVFRVPCRKAVYASDYRSALDLNRKIARCGFSKQTWNIVPKIKQVDLLLRHDQAARRVVKETHPEVCLRAISGSPLEFSKRTEQGIAERIRILRRLVDVKSVIRVFSQCGFSRHADLSDLLDSLVVGVVSSMSDLTTIPEKPEYDRFGLPMQMVVPKSCLPKTS